MLKYKYDRKTALRYADVCERAAKRCFLDTLRKDMWVQSGMCQYVLRAISICNADDICWDLGRIYRPRSIKTYYMGEHFDTSEQLHRMTALLFMAEIYRDMAKEDER